jgi:hypothetical protein
MPKGPQGQNVIRPAPLKPVWRWTLAAFFILGGMGLPLVPPRYHFVKLAWEFVAFGLLALLVIVIASQRSRNAKGP